MIRITVVPLHTEQQLDKHILNQIRQFLSVDEFFSRIFTITIKQLNYQ